MFFENFYEELCELPQELVTPLAQELQTINLNDRTLDRTEFCFKDGGKLILPFHMGEVRDEHFFNFIKPLISYTIDQQIACVKNSVPFRVEISILQPGKSVLWHHDQHTFHKFSERLHYPIITTDKVSFLSKWFTDKSIYEYKMEPGKIYRFNNRVPHSVNNDAVNFRCHVMIDWVNKGVYEFFKNKDAVTAMTKNVAVTPADEIYYFVNRAPKGVLLRGEFEGATNGAY